MERLTPKRKWTDADSPPTVSMDTTAENTAASTSQEGEEYCSSPLCWQKPCALHEPVVLELKQEMQEGQEVMRGYPPETAEEKRLPPGYQGPREIGISNLYITLAVLREWRKKSAINNQGTVKLSATSSVFCWETEDHEKLMTELQALLKDLAGTVTSITFDRSNVTGQIFMQCHEEDVPEAEVKENKVCLEAWKVLPQDEQGKTQEKKQAQIRDDDYPPTRTTKSGSKWCYVDTKFVPGNDKQKDKFVRRYVRLNWLPHVKTISMNTTGLSSFGVTALVAAAKGLTHLSLAHCLNINDLAIFSIVSHCTALRRLDVSYCPLLTEYGLLYIAEFVERVKQLEEVLVTNPYLDSPIGRVLACALDFHGFEGKLYFWDNVGKKQQLYTAEKHDVAIIPQTFKQNPGAVFDLLGQDITHKAIENSLDDATKLKLTLSSQWINSDVLTLILQTFGEAVERLVLKYTYITERGLSALKYCPNLRYLTLTGLRSIFKKNAANDALAPCIALMPKLQSVEISDTRLSGRIFSTVPICDCPGGGKDHKRLKLDSFVADRTSFSRNGVSLLLDTCCITSLKVLSLAGCSFLNDGAVRFITQLSGLEELDLSYTQAADSIDGLVRLLADEKSQLAKLRTLKVRGLAAPETAGTDDQGDDEVAEDFPELDELWRRRFNKSPLEPGLFIDRFEPFLAGGELPIHDVNPFGGMYYFRTEVCSKPGVTQAPECPPTPPVPPSSSPSLSTAKSTSSSNSSNSSSAASRAPPPDHMYSSWTPETMEGGSAPTPMARPARFFPPPPSPTAYMRGNWGCYTAFTSAAMVDRADIVDASVFPWRPPNKSSEGTTRLAPMDPTSSYVAALPDDFR